VEDIGVKPASDEEPKFHMPGEIAERLGGISQKTLSALIRGRGLETTTLGYSEPSRKGGRPRRVWGMTDGQLAALLALRNGRIRDQNPG
jgi:hypothetical protein